MINKPRKPWLCGILSLVSTGLGHVYTGEAKRGIILFLILQIIMIGATLILLLPGIQVNIIIAILIGLSFIIFCMINAVKFSKKFKSSYELKKYNRWYVYLIYILITSFVSQSLTVSMIMRNIVQTYKIPSGAMKPTLLIGDYVLVDKLTFSKEDLKRNDVIVFKYPVDPSKKFIKRIIGIPEDVIEIRDKNLYINQNLVNFNFAMYTDLHIIPGNIRPRDNLGPIRVPEHSLFVMGDNRDQSFDSRFWGFVDLDSVEGVVLGIYWSWVKDNYKVRWERIGKSIF